MLIDGSMSDNPSRNRRASTSGDRLSLSSDRHQPLFDQRKMVVLPAATGCIHLFIQGSGIRQQLEGEEFSLPWRGDDPLGQQRNKLILQGIEEGIHLLIIPGRGRRVSLLYSFANANKASSAVRYWLIRCFLRGKMRCQVKHDSQQLGLAFAFQFTQLRFG